MIQVFFGKGGVGKTTCVCYQAIKQANNELDTHLLSIDPQHSLSDAFGLRCSLIDGGQGSKGLFKKKRLPDVPNSFIYLGPTQLKDNSWLDLWKTKVWVDYASKNDLASLYIKKAVPIGKHANKIKDALINQLYTEYEVIAGQEILKDHDLLMIDTDSLEGLQRLINYANEVPKIGERLINDAEMIPVTTLEQGSLTKLNNLLFNPLFEEYKINQLIINNVRPNDPRLSYVNDYLNLSRLKKTIFYKQPIEPLGHELLMINQPRPLVKNGFVSAPSIIELKTAYLITGKGGQGKSTMACALAVNLAEQGKAVYLVSADARSSLETILDEPLGIGAGVTDLSITEQYNGLRIGVYQESPYWDNIPGTSLLKAMRLLSMRKPITLIIDSPPTGNLEKSLLLGVPSMKGKHLRPGFKNKKIIQCLFDRMKLFYHGLKSKEEGAYKYLTYRDEYYTQGLRLMQSINFQAIPVTQLTKTALVETNNLISLLNEYWINPYQPYNGGFMRPIIINKAVDNELLIHAKTLFEVPDFNPIFIPPMIKEPIGREKLSQIGLYMNPLSRKQVLDLIKGL